MFDHLKTLNMYLKSMSVHWLFVSEGEFYEE